MALVADWSSLLAYPLAQEIICDDRRSNQFHELWGFYFEGFTACLSAI